MTLPRLSHLHTQTHCDYCQDRSKKTTLISFNRMHGFGRNKQICIACRMKIATFLKNTRHRLKKSPSVQLANHLPVACPCGKLRKLSCSVLHRYTCPGCHPFTPCSACLRYVSLGTRTALAQRTVEALLEKQAKHLPAEIKNDLYQEAVVVILAQPTLYDTIKNDLALEIYAKDASIICLCAQCGGIACASNMVYVSDHFLCTKCIFVTALEDHPPLEVQKFIMMIVTEHRVSEILKRLTSYVSVSGGDAWPPPAKVTQFNLGEQEGTVLIANGRDGCLIGMPFLK